MLPNQTLYQLYTQNNIRSGLEPKPDFFHLNGNPIRIYSGSIHYFRVPKQYWRDRLRKLRASGLNTVDTFIPWNLHEPSLGHFDFGKGSSDFGEMLDVERFLQIAQEEDLLAIIRPGPYVCGELDLGGLPSWLLRENNIQLRSADYNFMKHVTRFWNFLLTWLFHLQFQQGGPIVAFQLENEYSAAYKPDLKYLEALAEIFRKNKIKELLMVSDSFQEVEPKRDSKDHLLLTINFGANAKSNLQNLKRLQPKKHTFVAEFYTGWFDHWGENHHTLPDSVFESELKEVFKFPASFNLYMFHGGTNFGFINGASFTSIKEYSYSPITSSYDYDAPLTEWGDYTPKYDILTRLITNYNPYPTKLPLRPAITQPIKYNSIRITHRTDFSHILSTLTPVQSRFSMAMEELPINNASGQQFGYIVYQNRNICIPADSIIEVRGRIYDSLILLINGKVLTKNSISSESLNEFGYWSTENGIIELGPREYRDVNLELIVENWGRVNIGNLNKWPQKKGLWEGEIYLDKKPLRDWLIYALEFRNNWVVNLPTWQILKPKIDVNILQGPALYRAILMIPKRYNDDALHPLDTFINTNGWGKGIIIVNGFVLGRYCSLGPQQTLYLPGPFLKFGENQIMVFEHFTPQKDITFSANQIFTQ